jgi:hypothetical protein
MPTSKYAAYKAADPYFNLVRTELMNAFKGYVGIIRLQSADSLIVHSTDAGRVIVIEYEVHGTVLSTGGEYNNRFCSIIHLENRKISHWRDYMDSHAAWSALLPPTHEGK